MAVWQFQLRMIPRLPVVARFGCIPKALPPSETWDWTWEHQPPGDYRQIIESFTETYPSWSPDILMWGSENGNRIHVVIEDGRVSEASARLTLREFSMEFAVGIISLAKHCDWLLALNGDTLSLPDQDALLTAVKESNAMKFVMNPIEFLEGIASGKYLIE